VATPVYQVRLRKDAENALQTLPEHIAHRAREFIGDHLRHQPTRYIPGKLKRLKGRLSQVWQYDLPSGYRLWYQVDEGNHLVRVIYIGPHPSSYRS
jgi:mRNA-degrading endonuclease RelE of RelBE toxin-antitoxin system